jgi:NADH dehydrogenase
MTTISNQDRSKEVVLLGGTGFVGRVLASLLSQQGYSVTIPTRHAARHRDMALMRGVRLIGGTPAAADMANDRSEQNWHEVLFEGSILINLIGILNEQRHDGKGFEQAHVHTTQIALEAAAKAGVKRYLHMSALGADANNGSSFYLRSKGKAEDWAHEFGEQHGIAVTSFRPSVIFGPQDSFLNRFARLARLIPGVFPLACADARFAPVYVGDVADQFVAAIMDTSTIGKRIDLCGPTEYRLRELVAYAAKTSGHPRLVIGLPDWAARLQARVLEWVPGQPFTRDNYDSLQTPSVCAEGCPLQTTRLERIAPGYLGK